MASISVEVHQQSATTSQAAIRRHRVLIDRPAGKGGADQGPMGGELFLAATAGCFMSTLLAAIRARETGDAVSNVRVEATGTLEQSPARFTSVELRVWADCEDRALLEKLVEVAERGCIMTNTLREPLHLRVRIGSRSMAGA